MNMDSDNVWTDLENSWKNNTSCLEMFGLYLIANVKEFDNIHNFFILKKKNGTFVVGYRLSKTQTHVIFEDDCLMNTSESDFRNKDWLNEFGDIVMDSKSKEFGSFGDDQMIRLREIDWICIIKNPEHARVTLTRSLEASTNVIASISQHINVQNIPELIHGLVVGEMTRKILFQTK